MCAVGRRREKSISNKNKQNDPRQTYLDIFAPTNLQCEWRGLMIRNNNVYKRIWEEGNKKDYSEKYICCSFITLNHKSAINQFTLSPANSHRNFDIFFMYHPPYF